MTGKKQPMDPQFYDHVVKQLHEMSHRMRNLAESLNDSYGMALTDREKELVRLAMAFELRARMQEIEFMVVMGEKPNLDGLHEFIDELSQI